MRSKEQNLNSNESKFALTLASSTDTNVTYPKPRDRPVDRS
jgi:hypothetical protein